MKIVLTIEDPSAEVLGAIQILLAKPTAKEAVPKKHKPAKDDGPVPKDEEEPGPEAQEPVVDEPAPPPVTKPVTQAEISESLKKEEPKKPAVTLSMIREWIMANTKDDKDKRGHVLEILKTFVPGKEKPSVTDLASSQYESFYHAITKK